MAEKIKSQAGSKAKSPRAGVREPRKVGNTPKGETLYAIGPGKKGYIPAGYLDVGQFEGPKGKMHPLTERVGRKARKTSKQKQGVNQK